MTADSPALQLIGGLNETPWPVRDDNERQRLETAAARHGLRFVSHPGNTPTTRPPTSGTVVGLGVEAFEDAALYARLTGRAVSCLDDLGAVAEVPDLEVVVTTVDRLDPDIFHMLVSVRTDLVPGLIFAAPDTLRMRCMVSALGAHAAIIETRCAELRTYAKALPRARPIESLLTQGRTARELRDVLASDPGLLVIQAHSDGIDSSVSDEHAFCGRLRHDGRSKQAPGNRCHAVDWCHRYKAPLGGEELADKLLDVGKVAAGIFLFDVCWGFIPPVDMLHPRDGLGTILAHNLDVTAMVSTWQVSFSAPATSYLLVDDLASGVPLGTAVAQHNRANLPRSTRHFLCVFGDPRTRLAVSPEDVAPPGPLAEMIRTYEPPRLEADLPPPSHPLTLVRYLTASPLMKPEESASLVQACDNDSGAVDEQTREELMRFVCQKTPRIDKHWFDRETPFFMEEAEHHCLFGRQRLRSLVRYLVRAGPSAGDYRVISLCQRCGVTENIDLHLPVTVEAERPRQLCLRDHDEHPRLAAQLVLRGQQKEERQVMPWPRDEQGRLQPSAEVPKHDLIGVLYLSAVLELDGRFSMFTFALRGPNSLPILTTSP